MPCVLPPAAVALTVTLRCAPAPTVMPLSDLAIRKAKPGPKPRKLHDANGLYLLVQPSGARWWRLDYRYGGKRKTLSMGVYPTVPLQEARERAQEARRQVAAGVDPSQARKAAQAALADTFAALAEEWLAHASKTLSEITIAKARWMLDDYVLPEIGNVAIEAVNAPILLRMIRKIESKGLHETAHRCKQRCSQIFRYGVATGRADRDPTYDLRGALVPVKAENHAAFTDPAKIRGLMLAIDGYDGEPITKAALQLAPLLFVRPGELRGAEWAELDLEAKEPVWRIPAERMKMGIEHVVPLAPQAVAILNKLKPLTSQSTFVFPSVRSFNRCMSENTVNAALRRMGFTGDEMTGHGFRTMASTRLNELGWQPDLIEKQLAHTDPNKVRATYNKAQYLSERRKMMVAWADYLDGLKVASNVTAIRKKGKN